MRAIGQAHFADQLAGARHRVAPPGNLHRHRDVLDRRQRRHEMEELEDEPDLLAAQPGERVLAQARDVDAVDDDLAGGRRVEPGQQAEQRGLAAARRAHDGHELPGRDRVVEGMQDGERVIAALHRFRDAAQFDHRDPSAGTGAVAAGLSIGSRVRHKLSATMTAPAGFG